MPNQQQVSDEDGVRNLRHPQFYRTRYPPERALLVHSPVTGCGHDRLVRLQCTRLVPRRLETGARLQSLGFTPNDKRRQLLWHGMFLFLLGLLVGFVEQEFRNPRMGLAAHLEGVMNGTFLVALGAIWNEIGLFHTLSVFKNREQEEFFGDASLGQWIHAGAVIGMGTDSGTPLMLLLKTAFRTGIPCGSS